MRPNPTRAPGNRVILLATAVYLFLAALAVWRILAGEVVPFAGSDSCAYLTQADEPWTSPQFYRGGKPPAVPAFWSLFRGGRDQAGIIVFQTLLQASAWLLAAFALAGLFRSRALGAALFAIVLAYSLGREVSQYPAQLLSESLSLSLMLATLAALIHFHRKPSWPRALAVLPAATLFCFSRDPNAYLLLGAAGLVAVKSAAALAASTASSASTAAAASTDPDMSPARTRLPTLALVLLFALLFAASQGAAGRTVLVHREDCYGAGHPLVKHRLFAAQETRHLFPLLNVFDLRILPYEFRRAYFRERGMDLNPAVLDMAFRWASQGRSDGDGWAWYREDSLQAARRWISDHGRGAYASYLLSHPGYAFLRPWKEIWPVYASRSVFDAGPALPAGLDAALQALRFATGRGKPLLLLLAAALAARLLLRRDRARGDAAAALLLAGSLALILLHALFLYHADAMDVERHAFGTAVLLDLLLLFAPLLLADRLLPGVGPGREPPPAAAGGAFQADPSAGRPA